MWYIIYIAGYFVAYGVARYETKRHHPEHWHTGQAVVIRALCAGLSWALVLLVVVMETGATISGWLQKEWPHWL